MIQVTLRNLKREMGLRKSGLHVDCSWRSQTNNAHRLLLFYAVENGLKALIMRMGDTAA
jgi:hypothetical protein